MNLEKVIFGFFIVLAMTLNFTFVIGELVKPDHSVVIEFFLVLVVNLIATTLKLGDRTQIGALLLATSLVADLQLLAAASIWIYAAHIAPSGFTPELDVLIVSHAAGALVSNVISVTMVVSEALMLRR